MDVYASEKEQIALVKELWQKYGLPLVLGVIFASVAIAGLRWFNNYRSIEAERASVLYQQLFAVVGTDDQEHPKQQAAAETIAQQIISEHSKSPYSAAAALLLARESVNANQLDTAEKYLKWVVEQTRISSLREVARLRLARIEVDRKKYGEALTLLQQCDDKAYLGAASEIKGDIFLAQNNTAQARAAFLVALQKLPMDVIGRDYLEMKFESVGGDINSIQNNVG